MTHRLVLGLCLPLACAAFGCNATPEPIRQTGDSYLPAAGESEFTFGGSYGQASSGTSVDVGLGSVDTEIDVTFFDLQLGFGQHLTRAHEVGAQLLVNVFEQEFEVSVPGLGDADVSAMNGQYGLYPYYRYNFRVGDRMQAYIGAHAGLQQVETSIADGGGGDALDVDELGFSYGAHVGMKSWLSPNTSFFVEPRFTITDTSFDLPDGSEAEQELQEYRVIFGFTFSY